MDKATKHFVDLTDNDHTYSAGDAFPRDGVSVSEERRQELISLGLIKAVGRKKKED